jgi:hypothetical protein
MSVAQSASQTARRAPSAPAPRAPAAPAVQRQTKGAQNGFRFASSETEDEIKVNLADITITRPALDENVFKPTFFSRLFDLISPRR